MSYKVEITDPHRFVICRNADYTVVHYIELEPGQQCETGQPIQEKYMTREEAQKAHDLLPEEEEYELPDGREFRRISRKQTVPLGAVKVEDEVA